MNYTLADGTPINSAEIEKLNADAAARRAARNSAPAVNNTAGLANARHERDAAIRELSKLTGRSIADIQADPKFARKVKPSPVANVPAKPKAPAPAKDALAIYNALPSGPAKRDFLAKHGVEIQRLAKSL